MAMEEEQNTQPDQPKKPGFLSSVALKILMLIVFALLLGMCSIKYMSWICFEDYLKPGGSAQWR